MNRRRFLAAMAAITAYLTKLRPVFAAGRNNLLVDFDVCVAYAPPSEAAAKILSQYRIAVLDSGAFPIAPIASDRLTTLKQPHRYAYFGVAVNSENIAYRKLLEELRKNGELLLDSGKMEVIDPLGPKSLVADLRKKSARATMISNAVKISQLPNYTGLFMDALDSNIALENQNSQLYGGLVKATIQFFDELREELQKSTNQKSRPDGTTKFSPGLMINGGFAAFTADRSFDPLAALVPACEGQILIESQLLDDNGLPHPAPLDFTRARLLEAARAAYRLGLELHVSFVEPRSKDPKKDLSAFLATATQCKALANSLCSEASNKSKANVTASVHIAHGNYVDVGPSLEAIESLRALNS